MEHMHMWSQNMLAMHLKYHVHSMHIFDSTQAPVYEAWKYQEIK